MAWQSVTLETERRDTDAFCDALLEAGALSVTLEDAEAGTPAEEARFDEPDAARPGVTAALDAEDPIGWRRNRLHVLLATGVDAGGLLAGAAQAVGWDGAPAYVTASVEDDDWVRRTQAQFGPQRIGERLWIVPSWHAMPQAPGAVVVHLDPGAAFGTGTHPTTRMVLRWIEGTLPAAAVGEGPRVLDYGCGSGILAIAAARLAGARADALDLDPLALEAARANAERNGVALGVFGADALPAGTYDVVLANILARPLVVLAPAITTRLRPGGRLALSGVLATQAEEVIAAYAPEVGLSVGAREEDWVLLEGRRRSDAPREAA